MRLGEGRVNVTGLSVWVLLAQLGIEGRFSWSTFLPARRVVLKHPHHAVLHAPPSTHHHRMIGEICSAAPLLSRPTM
jgi:hypothetical protein